ncbi:hypothetical protein SAMN02745131_01607 [Flavisolibacter ginsengisoli DSM 18119]|jgi:hypothetical protein|uniref:Uncharacterized protein n=1 Tax=Flavisolibacter ginsengisoli DSM 18119 TaxID=1121884 RepID=A0A1M4Y5F5_9BACT|nr:hypothetical protein SAMN02745131_01607 [Flavisolibacter ginsengisoli DSM 18119]
MSANDVITSDESRDGYLKLLVTAAVTHRERHLQPFVICWLITFYKYLLFIALQRLLY